MNTPQTSEQMIEALQASIAASKAKRKEQAKERREAKHAAPSALADIADELLAALAECCDNSDGERHSMELGCGNCEAGVPMAHGLACRARAAIRAARGGK